MRKHTYMNIDHDLDLAMWIDIHARLNKCVDHTSDKFHNLMRSAILQLIRDKITELADQEQAQRAHEEFFDSETPCGGSD
jgi:hypothetical protein